MIKKFFERDSVLKIVSFFVALLVWLYVIYIENPTVETTIDDVKITYRAKDLADGLCLMEYETKTVDVKVSGSRSDIIALESDDLTAVLDLSSINEAGTYKDTKINVSSSNKRIEIVESSEKKSVVEIDDLISKRIPIQIEYEGDAPLGCIVTGEEYLDYKNISVKGAKTYIDNIKEAYIKINQKDLTESKSVTSKIYLRDNSGRTIDEGKKAFEYIELENQTASVYVKVGKTKTVDIKARETNEYEVVSVSPDTVEIYPDSSWVNEIYTKSIDGKKPDDKGIISVKLDVPRNVTLVGDEQTVRVKVRKK